MSDSMIRVIAAGGIMFVGTLEGDVLKSPRALMKRPDGMNIIAPLPGEPKQVDLPHGQYVAYEPTNEQFVTVYREDVSGLKLPTKGNLVQMAGRA